MNRIWYYVFRWYAVAIKLISQKGYDKWIVRAHKKAGVILLEVRNTLTHIRI